MPLLTLLGQAVATFAASFGVGILPLMFKSISGKRLKIVSIFGMGLLVGAALTIIIPEGVATLYSSLPTDKSGEKHAGDGRLSPTHVIGITLLAGFALMLLVETLTPHPSPPDHSNSHSHLPSSPSHDEEHGHAHIHPHSHSQGYGSRDSSPPQSIHDIQENGEHVARYPMKKQPSHSPSLMGAQNGGNLGGYPSVPGTGHGSGERMTERMNSSTTLFTSMGAGKGRMDQPAWKQPRGASMSRGPSCRSYGGQRDGDDGGEGQGIPGLNATLGLCTHAAADGVALASSALSANKALGISVFLAVVIHKGPTALGLTTTLMALGLSNQQVRNRLLIFSASAPVSAILSYFLVKLLGGSSSNLSGSGDGIDGLQWWTGAVLLFSGGSFLYVATVISPISSSDSHQDHEHSVHEDDEVVLSQWVRLALLLGGMVLPLALSSMIGDHDH